MDTYDYFLNILSDYLNHKKSISVNNINWEQLFAFAQNHKVESIVFYQCKNAMPSSMKARFAYMYILQTKIYESYLKAIEEIENEFSKNNVSFIIVKGIEIACLYPIPKTRHMGDIDLVIKKNDKAAADKALINLGFKCVSNGICEWEYKKGDIHIELHDKLLYNERNMLYSDEMIRYADKLWNHSYKLSNTFREKLNDEFHFIYLLIHLRQHFLDCGVGFRMFIDLTVAVQNFSINWTDLSETLKHLKLLDFAETCFALCQRWFNIQMPFAADISENFYLEATEQILSNGLYGHANEENECNYFLSELRLNNNKSKIILENLFPTYSVLIKSEYYSFLRNKPWALPIAWLYRYYRLLRYKNKSLNSMMKSEEMLEKREDVLSKWHI